jgi:hypothetical protein
MALSWDHEDAERLVARLSPPASPQEAERALRRIFNGFARELFRERHESQTTKKVRKELESLKKALSSLSPRTMTVLCDALDQGPFLPHPYQQAQLVINPCCSEVPRTRLSGAVALRTMRTAVDRVLLDVPNLRPGHPGKASDATRRAMKVLSLVYCRCHGVPQPTWDFFAEEVRNSAAIDFAFECLIAWYTPGIEDLEPKDVIRSLPRNYSGRNQTG